MLSCSAKIYKRFNYEKIFIVASCYQGNGHSYMGNTATTTSGKTCQQWSSNTPQVKSAVASNPANFPDKSLVAAGNKCRNPDGDTKPWCYTTDPATRWEFCNLKQCPGKLSKFFVAFQLFLHLDQFL